MKKKVRAGVTSIEGRHDQNQREAEGATGIDDFGKNGQDEHEEDTAT